ncbi:DUF1073 domain-containing protein [Fulvimarina sp. 2208YS6-2-32]|uniref:Anti-CBASS protein Acb1 n=1 Tax=Fulvimarina uroteuthidis TaxID=3098149 RepID=A0ABU5HYR4_9HYPH|nr:anti-CBASS Acb1 family protein [Fulvimarina sp. 2208YS6-2-32]MDY8108268.1 DUF1073 domain-containing protein [Fulvimarina sp. 2208YS6-2-32]
MMLADSLRSFVVGMAGAVGLGTTQDKSAGIGFGFDQISIGELEAMYRADWLSRKIVDIIPNDMTREWRDWQAEKPQIEAIEAVEKAPLIDVARKVNRALRKARLRGGAAIFIGIRGADHAEPLDPARIKAGDLEYLHVLGRDEVTIGQQIRDVTSPLHGEPEWYEVQGTNGAVSRVHPSRMVRFVGMEVLQDAGRQTEQWGDSVLQVAYSAIKNATSAQGHIAALIPELKTDIIYVPGLSKAVATDAGEKAITKRFTYATQMRSMFSTLLLEGNGSSGDNAQGEKWEQKQISFAQMPELIRQYLQVACGAADIPSIRLLGEAPSGLGSNGESALITYYDNVGARQRTELAPQLHRLDEVIIRSALGSRPKDVYFEWSPLWTLNEKERAEVFSKTAEAARKIIGGGQDKPLIALEPLSKALANRLVEDGALPGLDAAIDEYGGTIEEEPSEEEITAASTPAVPAQMQTPANDAAPRTLYVRRDVVNAAEITAWAKSQGMTDIVDDLHVTLIYSRAPVDWIKAGNANEYGSDGKDTLTIAEGGPRAVEPLGNMAAVLLFASSQLSWRHQDIIHAGAEHGFPDYQPHVSLTKTPVDLSGVLPYRGKIMLGPEIFEELRED